MNATGPRILIAYDGSPSADAAIDGLRSAGLPERAEALVVTVAELWLPATPYVDVVEHTFPGWFSTEIEAARVFAESASARVRDLFPEWMVRVETAAGSAARHIVARAESWRADLVVTGSRGLTGFTSTSLGSISHALATEAPCSVRVTRQGSGTERPRVVVAIDGTAASELALDEVLGRTWRSTPEVLVLSVLGPIDMACEMAAADVGRVMALQARAETRLRASGFDVESAIEEGNPRSEIVEAAEAWGADAIFVGTRDVSRTGRATLGSVSAAVVTRAECSVEVVRHRPVDTA